MTNPNDSAKNLTKREYFVGLAMQGMIGRDYQPTNFKFLINDAIKYADLLIEKLNEGEKPEVNPLDFNVGDKVILVGRSIADSWVNKVATIIEIDDKFLTVDCNGYKIGVFKNEVRRV